MDKKISRRKFIKGSVGVAAGATAAGLVTGSAGSAKAAGPTLVFGLEADIPPVDKGKLRTIVVGGGWGGLTMAKHLKLHAPDMDVVLIEKRAVFFSCPVSNLWLADLVTYDFLTHSFTDAARNNNYTFFNATVVDVDREKRRLYTEQGFVDYDYLVLSPGIDYDYDDIGVHVPEEQYLLAQTYPAAFKPGSEHITLKRKIDEFEGGLFALTVPSGNYRCLPAPYERACMIASVFKRKKIPAKVLLLDDNHDVKIKGEGFHAAFDDLYKDYIEYYTSVDIAQVSVEKKTITGVFDDFQFDDAAIYPRVRGARLIETLGLVSKASPQKEARIDQYRNNYVHDKRIYIIGDSRSTGYSKSGSTAQAEARFVAKVIVERTKGNEIEWESPYTSCYSMVNTEPAEAIYFGSEYLPPQADITAAAMELTVRMWLDSGAAFAWRDRNMNRSEEMGGLMIDWATSHYQEMFG